MATLTQVASPATLATMDVDAALVLKAIEKKLQLETTLGDIFEELGAEVVNSGKKMMVPNAIFFKLEAVETGARQVTIPMIKPLSGAPTIGNSTPVGSEETRSMNYVTFYYDEYSHAVAVENWGINYNEMEMYGVFARAQPDLSKYMREFRGQRIREALLLTYDSVLTASTATDQKTAHFNKNWFIPNTAIGSQPAWDATASTRVDTGSDKLLPGDKFGDAGEAGISAYFTNEIAYTLLLATDCDTASPDGTKAEIDLDYLQALEYYASNYLRIDPIMVDGKETYVVLVPSTQATLLRKNTTGQLGEIWTSMSRTSGDEMNYNGFINRVGKLLLIEDQRYPTIQITGTPDIDGSGAATALIIETQFVKPGNVDNRHKDAFVGKDVSADASTLAAGDKVNFDIGFLLGKGAIAEWEVRKLHFEKEIQNYGKNEGVGVFGESGIQLVQWDDDTGFAGTNNTRENYGSVVLPFATPAVVTLS